MSKPHKSDLKSSEANFKELTDLCKNYQSFLNKNQVQIHSNPQLIHKEFLALDSNSQSSFIERLRFAYKAAQGAVDDKYSLIRDKRFVWRTLKILGAVPPSQLLDQIVESDYIEIYDTQGIQVFANFEFCRLITYAIEETSMFPWNELYSREDRITGQIIKTVERTFDGESGPFQPEVEEHVCAENRSKSGRAFKVKMKMFSPILNQNGQKQFLLATSQIDRIR